jgi:hypothetical protein
MNNVKNRDSAEPELSITYPKRRCVRCRKAEVYLDVATMDLCEPCLWKLVATDLDRDLTNAT